MDSEQLVGLIATIRKWLESRRKEEEKKPKQPAIPEIFGVKPYIVKDFWKYAFEHEGFDSLGVMSKSWLDSTRTKLKAQMEDEATPFEVKPYLTTLWEQAETIHTLYREYREELKK